GRLAPVLVAGRVVAVGQQQDVLVAAVARVVQGNGGVQPRADACAGAEVRGGGGQVEVPQGLAEVGGGVRQGTGGAGRAGKDDEAEAVAAALLHGVGELEQGRLGALQPALRLGEHAAAQVEDGDDVAAGGDGLVPVAAPLRAGGAEQQQRQAQ